jgi:hypothetical protein
LHPEKMSFNFARAADPQLVKDVAAANDLADEVRRRRGKKKRRTGLG